MKSCRPPRFSIFIAHPVMRRLAGLPSTRTRPEPVLLATGQSRIRTPHLRSRRGRAVCGAVFESRPRPLGSNVWQRSIYVRWMLHGICLTAHRAVRSKNGIFVPSERRCTQWDCLSRSNMARSVAINAGEPRKKTGHGTNVGFCAVQYRSRRFSGQNNAVLTCAIPSV